MQINKLSNFHLLASIFVTVAIFSLPMWAWSGFSFAIFFSAIPILFTTLSSGTKAGAIHCAVALLVLFFTVPIVYFSVICFPIIVSGVLVGHWIGLAQIKNGVQIWYPSQKIFFRICLLVFAFGMIMTSVVFSDYESLIEGFNNELRGLEIFDEWKSSNFANETPEESARRFLRLMHMFFLPMIFFLFLATNMFLASGFAKMYGMLRPFEDLYRTLTLERFVLVFFLPILIVAILSENPENGFFLNAIKTLALSFGFAYFIIGLCVIHYGFRVLNLPYILIIVPYFLLLFGLPVAIIMTVGMCETMVSIRQKLQRTMQRN